MKKILMASSTLHDKLLLQSYKNGNITKHLVVDKVWLIASYWSLINFSYVSSGKLSPKKDDW